MIFDISGYDTLPHSAIRLSVAVSILWLIASGWNLVMAVRQLNCSASSEQRSFWSSRAMCLMHRAGTIISLLALYGYLLSSLNRVANSDSMDSISLFMLLAQAKRPFEAHLLGLIGCEDEPFVARRVPETVRPKRASSTPAARLCSKGACLCPAQRRAQGVFMIHSTSNTGFQRSSTASQQSVHGLGIYGPPPFSSKGPRMLSTAWTAAPGLPAISKSPMEDSLTCPSGSSCSLLPPPLYPSSLHVPLHLAAPRPARRASSFSFEKE